MCPHFAVYLGVKRVWESSKPDSNPKATMYWPLDRLLYHSELQSPLLKIKKNPFQRRMLG